MTITETASRVLETHQAHMIRPRKGGGYDAKPWCGGNNRGWVILDGVTARAIALVMGAVSPELREKLESLPLDRIIRFCWKHIA
jgi:hypothetical protein